MRNNEFKPLFDLHGETIRVYLGKEVEVDPISHDTEVTLFDNPVYLTAIVTDLTSTQAKWKAPGIDSSRAKQVLIKVNDRAIIELSQKITIDGNDYVGWRENGKLQIRKYMNYLEILVYNT